MLTKLTLALLLASAQPAERNSNELTILAEVALERGDCKTASESYAAAVSRSSVDIAKRASEVALACEHLPAAWEAVQRWRALAPKDIDAASVYATIALKLYHVPQAQAAVRTVVEGREGDAHLAQLTALLLDEADPPAVLAAVSGAIMPEKASPAMLALLGELALSAHNLQRAEEYAQLALKSNPSLFAAQSLMAQVYAEQGDESNAIAAAHAAAKLDAERGKFEVADVLTLLEEFDKARQELERLRAGGGAVEEVDRRLALLALQKGDLEEAQRLFSQLGKQGEAGEAARLYLADIAAQKGDKDAALAGYRRLVNSSVAVTARTRAAGLLLERGSRAEALTLLDDYVSDHPGSSFEMTLAKTQLLAEHGEVDVGLTLLDAALVQHPEHPAIEYQRAVLLERNAQVKESVALLERLLAARPDDPTILNALGYTLADHNMKLPQAENLIRRALAVTPDSGAVIDSLGWVRYKRGDAHSATLLLRRAYALEPSSDVAAHLGEALWKSGAKTEARKVWAEALEREPDSEVLQAAIGRHVRIGRP